MITNLVATCARKWSSAKRAKIIPAATLALSLIALNIVLIIQMSFIRRDEHIFEAPSPVTLAPTIKTIIIPNIICDNITCKVSQISTGTIHITNTTETFSPSTGALVVDGGIGARAVETNTVVIAGVDLSQALFAASFSETANAEIGSNRAGATSGVAHIEDRRLSLVTGPIGNPPAYITFPAGNLAGFDSRGTFRAHYTPKLPGTGIGSNNVILRAQESIASSNNLVTLVHSGNLLIFAVRTSTVGVICTATYTWNGWTETEYEIEASFDSTERARLFINGTMVYESPALLGGGYHVGNALEIVIGSPGIGIASCNFKIRDVAFFPTVLHTASYVTQGYRVNALSSRGIISASSFHGTTVETSGITINESFLTSTIFSSSFASAFNAQFGAYPIATVTGAATVSNAKLDLRSSAAPNFVTYPAGNLADLGARGTIKWLYTPNYAGAPATTNIMISLGEVGSANNGISIVHNNAGNLIAILTTSTGVVITTGAIPWAPTAGTEYEFEFAFDVADVMRLFRDGVQLYQSPNLGGVVHAGTNLVIGIAVDASTGVQPPANYPNYQVRHIAILSSVLHTAGYTPATFYTSAINADGAIVARQFIQTEPPSQPNSLVRAIDVPLVTTLTLNGYWGPTVGNAATQTIYLQRVGSAVLAIAKRPSGVGATMSATSVLTFSIDIPLAFIEADLIGGMMQILNIKNPAPAFALGRVQVEYNPVFSVGRLYVHASPDWSAGAMFAVGSGVEIPPWSMSWRVV